MHVNEWLGKQQHALCPCHVAFVHLDRAWVVQVVGGLRVFCGSSCLAVGCAFVSGLAACECHPRAMVCVRAKHQLCDVHFSAVLVANDCFCDGRACLYAWGRVCRNGFQLEPGRAVALCACAVGTALWHIFIRQCGFDATVRMKRLDLEQGFPFLVFERVSCAELGLVVRYGCALPGLRAGGNKHTNMFMFWRVFMRRGSVSEFAAALVATAFGEA